ncbi:hypothetical protein MPG46_04365 [Helicobacter pylori]|uniref:hypothetical protein n=1 Tax=Helicobacter pylori TaxID=210 RepID=UPI001FCFC88A|nr:hypothetical protein [Helicobacter pylori]UOR40043.1 hypothetical protein MPG46_04365 [Helicobacter pylori]
MDLTNLENALNNSHFKEQVGKIQAIKNALSGYETSYLNNASFRDLTTQSIPTTNDWGFYKHSQAIVYGVLE